MDPYTMQSHSLHNRRDTECCSFRKNPLSGHAILRALRNIAWSRDLSICLLHISLLPSHSQEVLPGDLLSPSSYLPDPALSLCWTHTASSAPSIWNTYTPFSSTTGSCDDTTVRPRVQNTSILLEKKRRKSLNRTGHSKGKSKWRYFSVTVTIFLSVFPQLFFW